MPGKPSGSNSNRVPCLSGDEVRRLLSRIYTAADRARQTGASRAVADEILVLLLLKAGLRPHELCVLRIEDTPAFGGKAEIRIPGDGSRAGRTVDAPMDMVPTICRFVRLYRKGAKPVDPLFLSERGSPFSYMSLYSKIRRIGREAGLSGLHPGMLRRTFLIGLYERERDLRLVQEQAGHANRKTTVLLLRQKQTGSRCQACHERIAPGAGKVIDSGQLLCPACLQELRNH